MKIDPICRMEVDEATALTTEADGQTVYFCSEGCKDRFLANEGVRLTRTTYDLVIIGGGPAGLTAAVYAATLKMDVLLIAHNLGGQAIDSRKIENYMGFDFIAIGFQPNTGLVRELVESNDRGEIRIGADCSTTRPGIFAAGDCTDAFGKRIIIASGEGAKAALAARQYILQLRREAKGHVARQ